MGGEGQASEPRTEGRSVDPPLWITLGLPLVVVVIEGVVLAVDEELFQARVVGEWGLVENLTTLLLVCAVFVAVRLFLSRGRVASRHFGPFALVMALGCFFFAGEEASWGQHWIGFEPPKELAERNEQGEFNLHNDPLLETFLDQLPRTLLTAAALVGGILAPLVRRGRGRVAPRFDEPGIWGWIWPTFACLPASVLALTVTLPKKVADLPQRWDYSPGETKELALALFLFAYLWTLLRALRREGSA